MAWVQLWYFRDITAWNLASCLCYPLKHGLRHRRVHHMAPDWNLICTTIHGLQRMKPTNIDDPLIFLSCEGINGCLCLWLGDQVYGGELGFGLLTSVRWLWPLMTSLTKNSSAPVQDILAYVLYNGRKRSRVVHLHSCHCLWPWQPQIQQWWGAVKVLWCRPFPLHSATSHCRLRLAAVCFGSLLVSGSFSLSAMRVVVVAHRKIQFFFVRCCIMFICYLGRSSTCEKNDLCAVTATVCDDMIAVMKQKDKERRELKERGHGLNIPTTGLHKPFQPHVLRSRASNLE